jgi:peptide/nickel transport system substrate-binding protein
MAKISRRDFLKVSSLAAAGAVLAACGQATTVAPVDTVAPATAVPQATAVPATVAPIPTAVPATAAPTVPAATAAPKGPTSWPVGDVPRNRTLIYNNNPPAAGLVNPYASGYGHQNGNAILYEPGAFYAAHADKLYMWLAESAKPNADATQWTIVFRKGIKWSDGTAFTAHDPEWSMTTAITAPAGSLGGNQGWFSIEGKTAVATDDNTLVVTLTQTDWRFFLKVLTFRFDLGSDIAIQPMHVFKDVAVKDIPTFKVADPAKGFPVSTGAYGLGDFNDQKTNFDLRPSWWAVDTGLVPAMPDVWRIQQTLGTNETDMAQFLINKQVDQTLDLRPMLCASVMAQAQHLTTWTGKKPPYGYQDWWPISVYFTTVKKPYDNPDVRWAICYSIDQQAVLDIGWGGAGIVNTSIFPGFPKLNAYMDQIKDVTDQYNVLVYDLDKAAKLMTGAGFKKNKDGYWADKDGVVPDTNVYAGVPLFGDILPVVSEQLRTAGFASDPKSPPDVWTAIGDGRANMHLYGHGGSTYDPFDGINLYRKGDIKPLGVDCGNNRPRWSTDVYEAAAAQMNNTAMDDPKMNDLFRTCMTEFYKALPEVPLVKWFHRLPLNYWYWANWPDQTNPYMNSALWHLTMLQVVLGLKATGAA